VEWKRPTWFDQRKRRVQLDDAVDGTDTAHFGYRQMPAAEKVHWVRRHFDRVAPRYDFMNTLLSFGIQYAWKRQAVRMMALPPGARILDVCGGTGDLAVMAARAAGPGGRVVVCDINRKMLEAGVPKVRRTPVAGQVDFVQGDAERIPFPDGAFDAAMVGFGIRNLTHMVQGFREMHRVLRPGGIFLCLEFSKPVNPVFRWLYDVYSFYVMPVLGQLLTGSFESYSCLPETIRLFHLPLELSRILEGIGFRQVRFRRMTNGIAVAHRAVKA
jgi:demethylmenaquinone methyltransferase/2-methoxy-6-polyprenyl-1,4-benzoquinol methylase